MTFEEKVKFLRTLPQFKVIPISEVRAIAFATTEKSQAGAEDIVLSQISPTSLITLKTEDIAKIIREYPDLASKLV